MKIHLVFFLVLVSAIGLRFVKLDIKPMHIDEAINAYITGELADYGRYSYSHIEHHGPALYYFSAIPVIMSGSYATSNEFDYRGTTALFGILIVLGLFLLRNDVSRKTFIATVLFFTFFSPLVFFSRYFIHEIVFAFFAFLFSLLLWKIVSTRRYYWLYAGAFCAGMLIATKETWIIAVATVFISAVVVRKANVKFANLRQDKIKFRIHSILAILLVLLVVFVFYTSFFTNPGGVKEFLLSFNNYFERGTGTQLQHLHPWYFYFRQIYFPGSFRIEALIFVLGIFGGVFSIREYLKNRQKPASIILFFFIISILNAIIFSILKYKTPWNWLFHLVSLLIPAAYAIDRLTLLLKIRFAGLFFYTVLLLLTCGMLWQSVSDNFRNFASPSNPYVYSQTSVDYKNLVKKVENRVDISANSQQAFIAVVASPEEMWPMPWDFREFKNVGYWQNIPDLEILKQAEIIVASIQILSQFESELLENYTMNLFELRPNVFLKLYLRKQNHSD
jgi:uncharacterized protein (TIGR03663 family)